LEANVPFLKSLRLDGLLSFPPRSEPIPLQPLNVLIGPNGSGKSNLIEGIELLHALPTGFASAIREGGGVREWLWKGDDAGGIGTIEAYVEDDAFDPSPPLIEGREPDLPLTLRYKLSFVELGHRVEITDEFIEDEAYNRDEASDVRFYYRLQKGHPIVRARTANSGYDFSRLDLRVKRELDRKDIKPDESILMQLKDSFAYPELTKLGRQFGQIATFREWTFGRSAAVRRPQATDLAADVLASDSSNLGMLLNQLEHLGVQSEFHRYLSRFLPRFERFSTRVEGGTIQFYLHESGLKQPIPATRLSDGTIRFMAILAQLLSPTPPPLICMEEPELGLHPDAIALLASLLQEASAKTQLIVTTHSDALVSALTEVANSVLVCEYRGGTVLKRIESEKLRFWLDKYKLGEIWRIGEIGGNL
jgi:predicted ATPase